MNTSIENEGARSGPARITILFLVFTAFLNAVGFTIISPVVPFIVQQYLSNPEELASVVGWLTAIYAIFQFIAAPGLGVLSDRYGRRPILLICLLGSAVGYLIFGIGGALWVLFVSRIIDGITGANYSILGAYVGDTTRPEERGKLFGQIGGTVGVGMIVGPVLGGFTANLGLSAPLYAAAAILLLNTVWGFFAMPESLQAKDRTTNVTLSQLNPLKQIREIFKITKLRWLLVTGICYYFPFAFLTTELAVLTVDKLAWTPEGIGWLLVIVGCIDIIMQGFMSGKLIPIFGEVKLTVAGLVFEALAFVLIGAVAIFPSPILMVVGVFFFAFGSGLLEPPLGSLTSQAASQREQGIVQGGNQALRSLTQIAGPLLAGWLYVQFGGEAPFWLGAVIMLLGIGAILMAAQHFNTGRAEVEMEAA